MKLAQRLDRAQLARLPRQVGLDEYRAASAEIVAHLETIPGLVSVYQTGSISAPGISDLDYIAVVEAQGQIPELWSRLSSRTRYLAMHSPMVIDVPRFVRHRAFAHAEPLVLVSGEPLTIEPRPLPEYSEPLLAAEGLVNTVLRLAKQAAIRRVKVRPSLCEVNSIKYDLELGRIDRRRAPTAWELVDRIQDLRQSWFGGPPDRVRPILRDALEVSLQSLSELDAVVGGPLAPGRKPPGKRLTGPWKNVSLVGGSGSSLAVRRAAASTAVSFGGRWKDGSELAWRLVSATLSIPAPVADLLLNGDPSPPYSEFRRERDRTVAAYRSFISRNASGYSMMGVATMLL